MAATASGGTMLAYGRDARTRGALSVDRARLRTLLGAAPGARLVLVSAPAGYGKSTLLASWLEREDVRAAWYPIDVRDSDVLQFARRLGAVADRLAGDVEELVPDPGQPFDAELALARVLDALGRAVTEEVPMGVVVVLDDYHLIESGDVHRFVSAIIEHLPPGVRLAIATRADPPFPLARLRARGELVEVRATDLRFTADEADELLRSAGIELAPAEVEALTERTEGWAAVLRLTAVSLRGRTDRGEAVKRFGASHRFVLDYVVEDVLSGVGSETQDFLLRTSILDRLCGPLCDAITGGHVGQERLEELERANLLILPLDDERCWYRYHALFAEILRARLGVLHPTEIPDLHARASRWWEIEGDDDEAIAHALRSGDTQRSAGLIAVASLRRLNAGDLSTVRGWLDALPPEVVRSGAQLSVSYGWCLALAGETEGVVQHIAAAERALDDGHGADPLTDAAIRCQIALLRSRLADLAGDSVTAIEQARLARELVPAGLAAEGETTLRGDAMVLLARGLLTAGDVDGAAVAYEASLPDLRAGGNRFAAGRAIADLAAIAIAKGDPSGAARRCEAEIAAPSEASVASSPAVWAALARARLARGQGSLADAAARRALELAIRAGDAQSARSAERTIDEVDTRLAGLGAPHPGAAPGLVEPLTARELEVLRLVALGRSNSAIAAELFVTVGTVKSHVHAISGKLGAANRTESVSRGRALGLLDT